MTDKTISNQKKIGGDYFILNYNRKSYLNLEFYLEKFDVNDYWIYKATSKQQEVIINDFYDFKYASFIILNKNKYNNENINKIIEIIYNNKIEVKNLTKPLPPLEIIEKIKVI